MPEETNQSEVQISFIEPTAKSDQPVYVNNYDIGSFVSTKDDQSKADDHIYETVGKQRYSLRSQVKKAIFDLTTHSAEACLTDLDDPQTFKQAMARPDAEKWVEAMNEELTSLERCKVWELTERPDENVVSCRWVYKTKRNPSNEIERYRARLVARGFTQEKGKDYFETYSPVCDTSAIRLLFAYAALRRLRIKQFDVKAAFLHGDLNETVYIEQPPGFDQSKSKVYRLKKALYGLKQASKQWSIKFSGFLKDLGFNQLLKDNCIFIKKDPQVILAIYVDDAIILAEQPASIDSLISDLRKEFDIHIVQSNVFLGFQYVLNKDGSISLHQASYIKKIVQQYNMNEANSMPTPGAISETGAESKPLDDPIPFREAVGSLFYASGTTRFDITHATITAARASAAPTEADWTKVKRILRYLKGTIDHGITFHPDQDAKLTAYCDASFAGDRNFKSTTGYIFTLANGPIAWSTKTQSITTTSTCESEFV